MERIVYRTSLKYKIKVVINLILIVALVFLGFYYLVGVRDLSWMFLIPIVFLYTILSERYILTDKQLLVCSGFTGKHAIELSRVTSISTIKNGFSMEYINAKNINKALSIYHIGNQQQMIDEIEKRSALDSYSN